MAHDKEAIFRLALLRHADAQWPLPGERDFDRRLSILGNKEARKAADFFYDVSFHPSIIVASPAVRCQETLSQIRHAFNLETEVFQERSLYNSSVDDYWAIISQYIEQPAILLIGHNPMLEELLVKMLGHDSAADAILNGLQTAACAIIDIDRKIIGDKPMGHLLHYFSPGDASQS